MERSRLGTPSLPPAWSVTLAKGDHAVQVCYHQAGHCSAHVHRLSLEAFVGLPLVVRRQHFHRRDKNTTVAAILDSFGTYSLWGYVTILLLLLLLRARQISGNRRWHPEIPVVVLHLCFERPDFQRAYNCHIDTDDYVSLYNGMRRGEHFPGGRPWSRTNAPGHLVSRQSLCFRGSVRPFLTPKSQVQTYD